MKREYVFSDEKWKQIDGFPGYLISSYGRILSLRNIKPLFLVPQWNGIGAYHVILKSKNKVAVKKKVMG